MSKITNCNSTHMATVGVKRLKRTLIWLAQLPWNVFSALPDRKAAAVIVWWTLQNHALS